MLFEQQEQLSVRHLIQHFQREIPITVDHSCTICFPQPRTIPVTFLNFWNWIERYYFEDSFTIYTVSALPVYCQAYRNDPNINKSQFVVDLAVKLFLSIRYKRIPDSFTDLLYIFLNFSFRSNYFQDPITPQLIADFNSDVNFVNNFTFAAGATPTPSLRNSPVNTNIPTQPNPLPPQNLTNNPPINMASANEMKTIFQNIFGINPGLVNNGATLKDVLTNVQTAVDATTTAVDNLTQANTNRATGKIVDVPLFHR